MFKSVKKKIIKKKEKKKNQGTYLPWVLIITNGHLKLFIGLNSNFSRIAFEQIQDHNVINYWYDIRILRMCGNNLAQGEVGQASKVDGDQTAFPCKGAMFALAPWSTSSS